MMSGGNLARFREAQDPLLASVEAELAAGRKRSHWMWFIFPQIAGLGSSEMARRYAIGDLGEARRYLADPVLGPRLRHHVALMLRHETGSATAILGTPDDLKFRSSLTLFKAASEQAPDLLLFQRGLDRFYGGELDLETIRLLVET